MIYPFHETVRLPFMSELQESYLEMGYSLSGMWSGTAYRCDED